MFRLFPKLFLFACTVSIFLLDSCNDDKDPLKDDEGLTDSTSVEFAIEIDDSVIPYIIIDTKGTAIENEPKVPAEMIIYVEKMEVQRANIGIEYRGSTSFRISDKKSYGIETWDEESNDINVSFFGFPEEEDWILMGHVVNLENRYIFDRTLLYHYLGYEWSRSIGRYASRTKLVELELNGQYQGVYVFMEKLKRDGDRIDISKMSSTDTDLSGGYVLKIDKTAGGDENIGQPLEYFLTNWADDARYTEQNSFRSTYDIFGSLIDFEPYRDPYHDLQFLETYFLYEYPKADKITAGQKAYIADYVEQFEAALLTDDFTTSVRTYTDYIDVESFVDYLLLTELVRNVDAYRLSTYLQKDKGGKLAMGPIWDLNIGYDSGDRIPWDGWVYEYNNYVAQDAWMVPFWWTRLMEDPTFRQVVKTRWHLFRASQLSESSLIQSIDQNADYLIENGAVSRNYQLWDQEIGVDYAASIQNLKDFISYRLGWMDSQIDSF